MPGSVSFPEIRVEGACEGKGEAPLTNLLRPWPRQILRMGLSGVSVPVQCCTPSPRPTQQGFPGALQDAWCWPQPVGALCGRGVGARSLAGSSIQLPYSLLETEGVRRWMSHSVSAESANGDQNSRIFTCCGNPVGAVPGLRFPSVVRAQSLRVSCPGGCVSLCRGKQPPPRPAGTLASCLPPTSNMPATEWGGTHQEMEM